MRKFSFLTLLLVGMAGCATTPASSGNLIQSTVAAINDKMIVDDVVKKLLTLYPPASTRFDLQQATSDLFGTHLIESLRLKGYSVLDFKPEPKAAADVASSVPAVIPLSPGLPLSYVMDQAKGTDLYRVTLVINNQQSLDRVYQLQDGTIYPAGYWIRKE